MVLGCAVMVTACGGSPTGPTSAISSARTARLSRTRFIAFGDSLTAGDVTAPSAAYPAVLLGQLQAAYPSQSSAITVANAGKGAETIFDGVFRFEDALLASRAEVVLIQEGVNGLSIGGPSASTALMRVMVQQAKNADAKVLVGSMIPTLPGRQRTQDAAALVAYNSALQSMCTQEGAIYVDLYNGMLADADTLIGVDGLHPNEGGYRRIASLFFDAIRNNLEER